MKHNTIWNSLVYQNLDDLDLSDYEEMNGTKLTEEEKYDLAYRLNDDYLGDEISNLNIELPEDIICIADLGLWYGRRNGYKVLGKNLNTIFSVHEEYNEYYCDSWNVRLKATHHDGTNYCLFRMFREGLSDEQKEHFINKIYCGSVTSKDITRYTKSIRPYVASVYGW